MGNNSSQSQVKGAESPEQKNIADDSLKLKHAFQKLFSANGVQEIKIEEKKDNFLTATSPGYDVYVGLLLAYLYKRGTNSETLTSDQYCTAAAEIIELPVSDQLQFYYVIFTADTKIMQKQEFLQLLQSSYHAYWRMSGQTVCNFTEEDEAVQAMYTSAFGRESSLSESDLSHWCNKHWTKGVPLLHTFTTAVLQGQTFSSMDTSDGAARPQPEMFNEAGMLTRTSVWALSNILPINYIPTDSSMAGDSTHGINIPDWENLYDSNQHGLSVNRFLHHIMGYKGPSLLLIDFEGASYCLACDEAWRESTKRWGGAGCVLVKLKPDFRVLQSGSDLVYLNMTDRTAPKGLHVGKVLQIDGELNTVSHYGIQLRLHALEVWGCGGGTVRQKQLQQQQWERKDAEKHKDRKLKIDTQDWKDSADRALLQMGGVTVEHAER